MYLEKSIEELRPITKINAPIETHPDYIKKSIVAEENNKTYNYMTNILLVSVLLLILTQGFIAYSFFINAVVMVLIIIMLRKNIMQSVYVCDKYNLKHLWFVQYFRNLRKNNQEKK